MREFLSVVNKLLYIKKNTVIKFYWKKERTMNSIDKKRSKKSNAW